MPVRRSAAAWIAGAILLSSASPALADEQPAKNEPAQDSRAWGRIGIGYDRSSLFVGSPDSLPGWGIPVFGQMGGRLSDHIALGGDLVVQAGSSDHGIAMYRVAPGASFEFRAGPAFLSLGPHAVWFGAERVSEGQASGGFLPAEPLLWRLGVGAHAMAGVDLGLVGNAGVFIGIRADIDALVSVSQSEAAPNGNAFAVIGVSFR